tara:strand:+ start:1500 stop:2135 length:636 start_codon:yes stop_codon:yes gene_type:complete
MSDYRLITFKDLTPFTDIKMFGSSSLEIVGVNFSEVTDVLINGEESSDFIVVSNTKIIADIPKKYIGTKIRTVSILRASQVKEKFSIINFKSTNRQDLISGRPYAIQRFLKLLFTTPGKDIFNPNLGGGLLSIIGTTDTASIVANASSAVKNSFNQYISTDLFSSENTTLAERIKNVNIEDINFETSTATLYIKLKFVLMDGTTTEAGLRI